MRESRTNLGLLILLALAAAATYLPVWDAPFAEDDYLYLEATLRGDALSYLGREGVMDHHYRPLSDPLYFVLTKNATAYHALHQVFHSGLACLLFALGFQLGLGRWAAFVGALIYATRDFGFASMVWASGISDLGASFFAIASLLFYARWLDRRHVVLFALAVVAFICAVLTKETAVTTLLLYPIVDIIVGKLEGSSRPSALLGALRRQWPFWLVGIPIVIFQKSLAQFDDTYGQSIYALSIGGHVVSLWARYWFWSFFGVEEAFDSAGSSVIVYGAAFLGLVALLGWVVRHRESRRTGFWLAVVWFTLAVLPALLAPNRMLVNYVAIAAVGPCLAMGMLLTRGFRSRGATRILTIGLGVLLLAAGPVLVGAKDRQALAPGGWVSPEKAKRMARVIDEIEVAVPRPRQALFLFTDPEYQLAVLGDPDGTGFGPRPVLASALRWRYGRPDLQAIVLPPLARMPDPPIAGMLDVFRRDPSAARALVVSGRGVRDVTQQCQEAARQGGVYQLRAAIRGGQDGPR